MEITIKSDDIKSIQRCEMGGTVIELKPTSDDEIPQHIYIDIECVIIVTPQYVSITN